MHQKIRPLLPFLLGIASPLAMAFPPDFPPPGHGPYVPPAAAYPAYRVGYPAPPRLAYYRPAPAGWQWPTRPGQSVSRGAPARAVAAKTVKQPVDAPPAAQPVRVDTPAAADPPSAPDSDRRAFLDRLRPLIQRENERLDRERREVTVMIDTLRADRTLTEVEGRRLVALAKRYRVDGDPLGDNAAREALLEKIDRVPVSMALAQAANESAWGESRFAREGNNLFGIWTYDESKGMVPRQRAKGKTHLVRRFDNLAESVRYYLFTLNSHPAYRELRQIRAAMRAAGQPLDGIAMAEGLTKYSAKGDDYVRLIQQMIRRFDLATYDRPADQA